MKKDIVAKRQAEKAVKKQAAREGVDLTPMKADNNRWQESRVSGSILSAGMGDKEVANRNYLGSQSNNSIFDDSILDKMAEKKGGDEIIAESKEAVQKARNSWNEERRDEMVDALQKTDQRKSSSILDVNASEGQSYKTPTGNLSIFDNFTDGKDFNQVPDQTHGEKAAQESRQKRAKDDSWKQQKGSSRPNNSLDNFFDKLTGGK